MHEIQEAGEVEEKRRSQTKKEDKKDLPALYQTFGERFRALDSWSAFFITAYEDAPKYFGGKPTKNRKIYNGMIKNYNSTLKQISDLFPADNKAESGDPLMAFLKK